MDKDASGCFETSLFLQNSILAHSQKNTVTHISVQKIGEYKRGFVRATLVIWLLVHGDIPERNFGSTVKFSLIEEYFTVDPELLSCDLFVYEILLKRKAFYN